MFDLHYLWFTPVLPPDVCLSLLYLDTPVLHHEPWTVCHGQKSFNVVYFIVLTWLKVQPNGIQCFSCLTRVIRPHFHLLSHVDNVPYY